MTREEKTQIIGEITEKLANNQYVYVTDASGMSVADINKFRRLCFERGVEYKVYKNTLFRKALETTVPDVSAFNSNVLQGYSGFLFSNESGKAAAGLLKEFYKGKPEKKPVFKGASIDSSFYYGDGSFEALLTIKSKKEMIGEVIGLLQSPAKNVIGALQSGGNKLAGILKTLSEKEAA